MTIGGSIALIVLGAILAFAVTLEVAGIDIRVVGFILLLGGAVGLIVGLSPRRRGAVVRETRVVDQDPEVY
ncbi:MAG: hypothetical protein KG028_15395 [Actinobacteria bacterium]|jgi:hypothetical protein|nr:hypothetical protein [Actinomycetota bacterium]MBS3942342.1 hypothetical protein [Actinomycetota bacterium]